MSLVTNNLSSRQAVALMLGALLFGLACDCCKPLLCLAAQEPNLLRQQQKRIGTPCVSAREAELVWLINNDREFRGLPPLQVSRALSKVARAHAVDLQINRPDLSAYALGMDCNMHSWSSRGNWRPGCYTSDHRNDDLMKNKPREITDYAYDEKGYEAVYWVSEPPVVPFIALLFFLKSSEHRDLLFESGKWSGIKFRAIGVGISNNFATVWLGTIIDPLGTLPDCGSGQQ